MSASRCEQAQRQLFHDPSQIVRGICVFPALFSAYTDTRAQTHVHVHAHAHASAHTQPSSCGSAACWWRGCVEDVDASQQDKVGGLGKKQKEGEEEKSGGGAGWVGEAVVVGVGRGIISAVYVFSATRPPLANHTGGHLN